MEKKHGLAVFYDPQSVYEFLWVYSMYGKELIWDAICFPNSDQGDVTSEYVKRTEVFESVTYYDDLIENWSTGKQLSAFLQMLLFALIGKQANFAKRVLRHYADLNKYEEIVVLTDVGFISGLFITLSKEKSISILEDGTGDYLERSYRLIWRQWNNLRVWKGFLMSFLGYNNIGHSFPYQKTKYCTKYCSYPEKMLYTDYKELRKLYDFEKVDVGFLNHCIDQIYPELKEYFDQPYDVILFTGCISDFTKAPDKYYQRIEEWINKRYTKVLLKKHPRDTHTYQFADTIQCVAIGGNIPAQVMQSYLTNEKLLFLGPSSTLLSFEKERFDITILMYKGLEAESIKQTDVLFTYTEEWVKGYIRLHGFQESIVEWV